MNFNVEKLLKHDQVIHLQKCQKLKDGEQDHKKGTGMYA